MTGPLPKLQQIPAEIACAADYEPFARERMSAAAWAYMAGGAGDEWTLRENVAAFQRIALRSRVLADLRDGHTRLNLFGRDFDHPILLAPVAFQKLVHPEGELETVLGAGALRAGMVVSTQASATIEEIAREAAAPLWFQLYLQPDRDFTRDLIRRAETAGYAALVLTVDAPVSGPRNREQRAGFALPEGVAAVNLHGMTAPPPGPAPEDALLLGGPLLRHAARWEDIAWLRAQTSLPVILKGVTTAEDSARAVEAGVDGIIVSNHGGRTLDGQCATVDALPEVAAAVSGRVPVLLDGGVRRGGDAFRALALGASAVLIGRPYIYGLAAAGAVGVAHVIRMLRAELEIAMALTGCRTLDEIDAARLRR